MEFSHNLIMLIHHLNIINPATATTGRMFCYSSQCIAEKSRF
nr:MULTISPECIES: hypothetical protein [unclassified Acinetobacter]